MNDSKRPHVASGEVRGINGAVRALRAGNLGPVEILEECLERIEASESAVGAWVEIDADGARRTALRQAELLAEEARGLPLLGIPIGMKDIIDVAGMPTRAGSVLRAGHRAQRDAPIAKILRDLGAILLGKTETTQFACTDPARTRNPWNVDHSPGGSSAGSAAAVASGMCLASLGSQTGGSITRPASFCGVASFKGAWGAWPLDGIVPVSQHLDHVGPMARSVADLALLWTLVEARLRPERAADLARRSEAVIAGEWFECAPPRLAVLEELLLRDERAGCPRIVQGVHRAIGGGGGENRALPPARELRRHAREPSPGDGGRGGRGAPKGFRGAARYLSPDHHAPHREGPRGLGRRLPGRTRAPAALRGRPRRRARCAGRAGRRTVAGDGVQRAAVRGSGAPGPRSSTRYGRSAGCRRAGCRRASARTGYRSACSSARRGSRSRCFRPRHGARRSWSFPAAIEGWRSSVAAAVALRSRCTSPASC